MKDPVRLAMWSNGSVLSAIRSLSNEIFEAVVAVDGGVIVAVAIGEGLLSLRRLCGWLGRCVKSAGVPVIRGWIQDIAALVSFRGWLGGIALCTFSRQ